MAMFSQANRVAGNLISKKISQVVACIPSHQASAMWKLCSDKSTELNNEAVLQSLGGKQGSLSQGFT